MSVSERGLSVLTAARAMQSVRGAIRVSGMEPQDVQGDAFAVRCSGDRVTIEVEVRHRASHHLACR